MSNLHPSPETRIGAPRGPKPGRGSAARGWMRRILDEKDPEGTTERERIFRHQVEVAQAWEVRIVGKTGEGELLKVASGRDSTAAAEFVFGLIGLKPLDVEKNKIALAEHIRAVARDSIEIGRQLIGKQAEEWPPEKIRAFWDICERDPARFLRAAEEALGTSEQAAIDVQPDARPEQLAPTGQGDAERAPEPQVSGQVTNGEDGGE